MRVPWTARTSNQSIPKEINPLAIGVDYSGDSMEKTLMLEMKAGGEGDDRV